VSERLARSVRALQCMLIVVAGVVVAPARGADAAAPTTVIRAVGSTNVYADVIRQIGGNHVTVLGILSNPNADPHSYESSTTDARAVEHATLIVQNGMGYDAFMNKLEDASPNRARLVIDAGSALGYHDGDNPHIWYNPATMPRLAALIAADLSRQDPAGKQIFATNVRAFDRSLKPWTDLIATVKKRFAGTPVAITEPVFGYAALAMGFKILTPNSFAMAIMQGNDPAPQDVQTEEDLFTRNAVKCFFYNQQAVAPITVRLLALARAHHIPIVGVYETKPLNKTYQQWMLAETNATFAALAHGTSTEQIH
jgi:zinc/manganese transport system substrate-binding protein